MEDQTIEGWYLDPYGIHERRWMSGGKPTSLVRDAGAEVNDAPPDGPPSRPVVPAPVVESALGGDLRRADDADKEPSRDLGSYADVALTANAVLNNPITEGVISSGPPGGVSQSPFYRKLRQRARRERWAGRWHKLLGGQ